ncbi:hypothetical protein FA13DRAFT_1777870 [Coprinellus micaceus]|uniref:Uncharacterized protein n=1 Tax=Coprinellus micaceus TaxID=71717 RepID=A0A4Y7SRM0_COPMI|nr:hypothetical protein FA13DRAFT_1777870 [Coprinellus micaceus]
MDREIDDLVASFARLHISPPPLLPGVVAVDRQALSSHKPLVPLPPDDTKQRSQVVVEHDGLYTTVHRRHEERQVVHLSTGSEQQAPTHDTATQYQTVTVSTVVNHIQRVENSNFGANYGNQSLIKTRWARWMRAGV